MIPLIFFILFAFFLLYFIFGIYILFKNRSSLQNRMFFSLCINLSLWALGYTFMATAPNQEVANFWRLVSAFGWCLFYSVWLDFCILVKSEDKKWMTDLRRLLIYLPSIYFIIGNFSYKPSEVIERFMLIWEDTYPLNYFEILYILYSLSYSIAGIAIIYLWGKNSTLNKEKKQSNIIVLSTLLSFLLASLTDIILPILNIGGFHFGILMFSIALFGIFQAITRYDMMSLSTQAANEYVLKTISDPVILIGSDLRIKVANNAAIELTGFEEAELMQLSFNEIISDADLCQELIHNIMNLGPVKNIEIKLVAKQKDNIPCLFSGSFIYNEFEDILGIACIFHDITDRIKYENILLGVRDELEKKVHERTKELIEINTLLKEEIHARISAEEDLVSSNEKFKALIKQSSDGIIVLDQETRKLVEVNDEVCNKLGLTEEQISVLIGEQLLSTDNSELQLALYEMIERKTKSNKVIVTYLHSNGTTRNLKLCVTFVGYNNKQYIMITIRDITEEVIMEDQKQQMAKMDSLGTLSGGIAHDFNNILAGIMGYTQLTLEELEEDSISSDNLQEVLKLGERAKKLISQILTFSKKTLISPEIVELSSIIKEVLNMLKATLPANIDIKYRQDEDSFHVYADQGELHQLIMNLCVNAELAMSKTGGTLQVILTKSTIENKIGSGYQLLKPGKYIKLEVVDNGCGMDDTVKKRIFEPFFTTRGGHGGTGLGLSVVHGIVNRLEGVIMVDSELNKGSNFTVYLPNVDSYLKEGANSTKMIESTTARILLVDDEESIVKAVQKLLNRLGYHVTGVLNSREALELFRQNEDAFDIVITDQSMPDLLGDALIKELRIIKPGIPVVICSGYNHELNVIDVNKTEFLLKPVPINDYVRAIEKLLKV